MFSFKRLSMERSIHTLVALLLASSILGISGLPGVYAQELQPQTIPPAPCVYRTEWPHRSSGVVRTHATTDCTGVLGVTAMSITTNVTRDGYHAGTDPSGAYFRAGWWRSTVDSTCRNGSWYATSVHFVVRNGATSAAPSASSKSVPITTCPN